MLQNFVRYAKTQKWKRVRSNLEITEMQMPASITYCINFDIVNETCASREAPKIFKNSTLFGLFFSFSDWFLS